MKSNILFSIIITLTFLSCSTTSFFKDKITVTDLLAAKEHIDSSKNPAEVLLLKNDLAEKILLIDNITVKDIITSTNVDYDFCVLGDIQTDKGLIECLIYSKNVRKISQLKKGESIISVKGEFKRYFSMLDNYYTKFEVTNSEITIKNTKTDTAEKTE